MTRVESWPEVLAAELATARRRPFNWDGWNCVDFVAQVVKALTGTDHREQFPTYRSEAEANALLEQYGGVQAIVTQALGEAKPAASAQRGDVVLIDFGQGLQPAVCAGLACFAPGPRGLHAQPTNLAVAAWTV